MTDHVNNAFQILKDIDVPETQNTKTFRFEYLCSLAVLRKSFSCIVLSAIEFNDEPATVAGEIGNEARDRNLSAKMPSFLLEHAQFMPQFSFGIGDIAAQATCKMIGHCPDPHP